MKICNSTAKIHKKLNVRVFFSPQSLRVRKEQKEIRDLVAKNYRTTMTFSLKPFSLFSKSLIWQILLEFTGIPFTESIIERS